MTSPITDNGNSKDVGASVSGITQTEQIREALLESERRYRELADFLPQIVFEIDEAGNFTFANRQAYSYSGYRPEDIDKGLNALELFVPEDRERVRESIRRILSGEQLGGNEYTAQRKDGSTFPVIVYSVPIVHDNKRVGLRGIVVDMTEVAQFQPLGEGGLTDSEACQSVVSALDHERGQCCLDRLLVNVVHCCHFNTSIGYRIYG